MFWLLLSQIWGLIFEAKKSGRVSAEERTKIMAACGMGSACNSRIMAIAGKTAEINVTGVLTQEFDFEAYLFGGGNTLYREIIAAIREADADPDVDDITMYIESPGGSIAGLYESIEAIRNCSKPIKAVVANVAASAAYALACACNRIEAKNPMAMFGSVGVLIEATVSDSIVKISNSESPNKAPDAATAEGKATIQKELDKVFQGFVQIIADGRKTTVDKVKADFGQGSLMLAKDALDKGMIDAISSPDTLTTARSGGTKTEAKDMNLKELRAQHPDVYAEAVQEGKTQERDRVTAHLTLGESSGDMSIALKAIKEGLELTAPIQAEYMAAGIKKAQVNARSQDDKDAGDATGGASKKPEGQDGKGIGEQVANIIAARFGLEEVK